MIPDRYTLENLIRAISNPSLIKEELSRVYRRQIKSNYELYMQKPVSEYYFEKKYGTGVEVLEEDWDNLIILDSLRYDALNKINCFADIEKESQVITSQASNSFGFVKRNFEGKEASETVYVTANGWNEKLDSNPFFLTKKTYDDFEGRYSFYEPKRVYDLAIETFEHYPNKRYVIHFMQPHTPYLGEEAERLRKRITRENNVTFDKINKVKNEPVPKKDTKSLDHLQDAARNEYIADSELWEVYIENVEIVLPYVKKLSEELGGKTVITADHGELMGEKCLPFGNKLYGHTGNLAVPELRNVPWLTLNYNERRTINNENPIQSDVVTDQNIKESLEALGYY